MDVTSKSIESMEPIINSIECTAHQEKMLKRQSVMNSFEETEKAFQELLINPPPVRSPRITYRSVSMSPSTASMGLDHLDNLCRIMEQLAQLKGENNKLRKRCSYLEDTKALLQARNDFLNLTGEITANTSYVDKGGTWPSVRHAKSSDRKKSTIDWKDGKESSPERKESRGRLSSIEWDDSNPESPETKSPVKQRKRSQSMDSLDLMNAGIPIFTRDNSDYSTDYKKHGHHGIKIDKQKLMEAKEKLKKLSKWNKMKKVFSATKESSDISEETPKLRKRSKTTDMSLMTGEESEEPYFGVWMGPPEWLEQTKASSEESLEKQEVHLSSLEKRDVPFKCLDKQDDSLNENCSKDQLGLGDQTTAEPGSPSLHSDGKKGRTAWGRVRDILHTRKDSLKRKSGGKSAKSEGELSHSDENLSPSYSDYLETRPKSTSDASPRQSPALTTKIFRLPTPTNTPPASPSAQRKKKIGVGSPISSPRLGRKAKVTPQTSLPLPNLDSQVLLDGDGGLENLQANISEDFAKKMEEWEKKKIKTVNRLSGSSPLSPRHDMMSAPSSPGPTSSTPMSQMEQQMSSNLEDMQRSLTDSFNRKLENWERIKFQKRSKDRSPSLDRRKDEKSGKSTSREKIKTKKEKTKQNKDQQYKTKDPQSKTKQNKKRNKQEGQELTSENSVDGLTDEFARRLREWEIKKGFTPSDTLSKRNSLQEMSSQIQSVDMDHDRNHSDGNFMERMDDVYGDGISPYLDPEDEFGVTAERRKCMVDDSTSIDVNIDIFKTLEQKNHDLAAKLQEKDDEVKKLQAEINELQKGTSQPAVKGQISCHNKSRDLVFLSSTVSDLQKKILELQKYGEALAAEKRRLEVEAVQADAEHYISETQLQDEIRKMQSTVGQGLSPPPVDGTVDTMQEYVRKLRDKVNDLKLGILERNHAIESLRHCLLTQEVNQLLLTAETARHSAELGEFRHTKKAAGCKRWKTFSGMELWLTDQLNKAGLDKTLDAAVQRCKRLRNSCLSFDQNLDQFRHGDINSEDVKIGSAPSSPTNTNFEMHTKPETTDVSTLTSPTVSSLNSPFKSTEVNSDTNRRNTCLKKQSSRDDANADLPTNIEVSFVVQLDGGVNNDHSGSSIGKTALQSSVPCTESAKFSITPSEGSIISSEATRFSVTVFSEDVKQQTFSNKNLNKTDEEKTKLSKFEPQSVENGKMILESKKCIKLFEDTDKENNNDTNIPKPPSPLVISKRHRKSKEAKSPPPETKDSQQTTCLTHRQLQRQKISVDYELCSSEQENFVQTVISDEDSSNNRTRSESNGKKRPPVLQLVKSIERVENVTSLRKYSPSPPNIQHTVVSPVRKLKTAEELLQDSKERSTVSSTLKKIKSKAVESEPSPGPKKADHDILSKKYDSTEDAKPESIKRENFQNNSKESYNNTTTRRYTKSEERVLENKRTSPSARAILNRRSPSPQVQEITRKLSTSGLTDPNLTRPPLKDLPINNESTSKVKKLKEQFGSHESLNSSRESTTSSTSSRASPAKNIPQRKISAYDVPKLGTVAKTMEMFQKHNYIGKMQLAVFEARLRSQSSPEKMTTVDDTSIEKNATGTHNMAKTYSGSKTDSLSEKLMIGSQRKDAVLDADITEAYASCDKTLGTSCKSMNGSYKENKNTAVVAASSVVSKDNENVKEILSDSNKNEPEEKHIEAADKTNCFSNLTGDDPSKKPNKTEQQPKVHAVPATTGNIETKNRASPLSTNVTPDVPKPSIKHISNSNAKSSVDIKNKITFTEDVQMRPPKTDSLEKQKKSSRAKSLDRAKRALSRMTGGDRRNARPSSDNLHESPREARRRKSQSLVVEDSGVMSDEEKKRVPRSKLKDSSWIQRGKKLFRVSNSECTDEDESSDEIDV